MLGTRAGVPDVKETLEGRPPTGLEIWGSAWGRDPARGQSLPGLNLRPLTPLLAAQRPFFKQLC